MVTKLDTELMSAGVGSSTFEAIVAKVWDCSSRHNDCARCKARKDCQRTWLKLTSLPRITAAHFRVYVQKFEQLEKSLPAESKATLEAVAIMLVVSVGGLYSFWG